MPLEKDIEADADLATILGQFTNYIGNERVRAYNEGVDAETERCAKIADGARYVDPATGSQEDAWNDACDHIADGIRRNKE